MPRTPLHAALGDVGTTLDFGLIERACENRVTERADLDWKQQLPLTATSEDKQKKVAQQAELAKDIAAMANSGGGMIVYGVAEARIEGTSAADHVVPAGPVDEGTSRSIRQVAGNLIYPPVTGLDLRPLAPADDPEQGVLILLVPDSPDAPHLVHPRNTDDWFGVPYRHGPDTEWMVERQIADAYRAREAGHRKRRENFNDRFDRFVASCGVAEGVNWIVAMAVPETPLHRPRDLRLDRANRIIERAWRWPVGQKMGPRLLTGNEVTRRGLQRYYRFGRQPVSQAGGATPRARVEVHGDGTVAMAFTRDGFFRGETQRGEVALADIEQTGLEFFALLWTARTALGVTGDYSARIAVEPSTQVFRRLDPHINEFLPFDESHRVLGYAPVDGPVLVDGGRDQALTTWLDLVRDAVNQAGVTSSLDAEEIILQWQLAD
ncbi:helix-turn-helix domain-containing protein [Modestobacter sp. Leaf380]|uniref:AlbA family DNA-binding domain-containing protein n=1 Tax=Modestobacter sp. Leaf380 TaxID=1736356 RepID=UPI0006FF7723|nr:ATP-binding protein [Modestobacter sp. Leaf380]KQS69832.1 hypothetical protein ASG41_21275 [Modestobacter sp. Leaf380]